jgi:succinoglycan biosynthesis protein ExoA
MSAIAPETNAAKRNGVLVVIPCLNEQAHIETVLRGLAAEAHRTPMRIVVADGGSTDGTRAIVERIAAHDPRVILLDNPKRIQSAGVNLAARLFGEGCDFLLRVDAHARYPNRFCERLLAIQAKTDADSVVVAMRTVGRTCFERAAAAAQNSLLGNGGSAHRNHGAGRWVDHGHHALFRLAAFRTVDGYDETFSHNEDVELDLRLRERDFRIYLAGGLSIDYFPRGNPLALYRQYNRIGRGRARNAFKHRQRAKARHLVLASVAPILLLALLAPVSSTFVAPAAAWAVLCLGYGAAIGVRLHDRCAMAAGVAAMATQAGWSFGFLAGVAQCLRDRAAVRRPQPAPAILKEAGDERAA